MRPCFWSDFMLATQTLKKKEETAASNIVSGPKGKFATLKSVSAGLTSPTETSWRKVTGHKITAKLEEVDNIRMLEFVAS